MTTNRILPLSLVLNVALVAFGVVALRQNHAPATTANLEPPPPVLALPPKAADPSLRVAEAPAHSWQWSDLVSNEDATYVANLRAIGCPEWTIRDLVTAAIGHRYDQQRQDLAVQHQQGRIDAATMQAAVAQTWEKQNDTINHLPASPATASTASQAAGGSAVATGANGGGVQPASGQFTPGGVGAGGSYGGSPHKPAIATPLALADPPASLGLNDSQVEAAARVGDSFAQTVAGLNLAPTDPAYHRLWRQAQQVADDQLKAQIGGPAFVQWQMQTAWTQLRAQGAANR